MTLIYIMERLISISKAAYLLGVHPDTLRNWDDSGQLRAVRTMGGHRRYKLSEIENIQENADADREEEIKQ